MKQKIYIGITLLFFISMVLCPGITLSGTKEGLLLWFHNLLPALFPYTILSTFILRLNLINSNISANNKKSSKKAIPFLNISPMGLFAVFTGFMCGYPLGAKITAQLVCCKKLTLKEGQYLMGFCNMASPGFLIQYVTAQSLGNMEYLPGILLCIYGSTILTAILTYKIYFNKYKQTISVSQIENKTITQSNQLIENKDTITVGDSIIESFEAMVRLGGYLVLFTIIAKMVTALFTTVTTSHFFLIGVIEITKGVNYIATGNLSETAKLLLLAFCLGFGGISCFAQSAGMCQNSGLSMPKYFVTKLMNGLIALALMYTWCIIH